MRLAIDAEAILSAFSGNNSDLEDVVRPSILAITKKIMDDYDGKISLSGSGIGKDWLNRVYSSAGRMRIVSDSELAAYALLSPADLDDNYVGAAYYNGHLLIRDSQTVELLNKVKRFGLDLRRSTDPVDISSLCGHKVVAHYLLDSTTRYNHSLLRRYFASEKKVVVYDRYLKESSVRFLENVLSVSSDCVNVVVISEFDSSGGSLIAKAEVESVIRKIRPHGTVSCLYPNFKEMSDKHDRHIYLGDRLQLTFSSGIDCFGLYPAWNNSECDVQVYYVSGSSNMREYPVKKSLKGATKVLKVRSKI